MQHLCKQVNSYFRATANVLVAMGSVKAFRLKLAKRVFKGITFLSCFEFQDGGILTHKSANIGPGNFVTIDIEIEAIIKQVSMKNQFDCKIMKSDQEHTFSPNLDPAIFMPERKKLSNFKKPGTKVSSEKELDSEDEDEKTEKKPAESGDTKVDPNASIYKCPNNHCIKDYIKFRNYAKHLSDGICKARLRTESQKNLCKTMWFSRYGNMGCQISKEGIQI